MNLFRRLRVPFTLVCAVALTLVFAASAGAETRTGETTSPVDESISGEADILAATANYDSGAGAVSFTLTTREATKDEGEYEVFAELGTPVEGTCVTEEQDELPVVEITATYSDSQPNASWLSFDGAGELEGYGRARLSQSGSTSSLTASSPELANQPYICAVVATISLETSTEPEYLMDEVAFPLHVVPPAPAPTPPSTTTPAPKPGLLSLGASKPLTLKAGKWGKVKVTLTNSGGTAIWPVNLKAKAPVGVVVKPGSGVQSLPALLPGQSWTVGFSVELTAKAKRKSTISFAGSAPGIAGAASSVVVTEAPVVRPRGD